MARKANEYAGMAPARAYVTPAGAIARRREAALARLREVGVEAPCTECAPSHVTRPRDVTYYLPRALDARVERSWRSVRTRKANPAIPARAGLFAGLDVRATDLDVVSVTE